MSKPFVLFIEPGSKRYIEDTYKSRCNLLSKYFSGEIITFGAVGEYYFNEFKVNVFSGWVQYKFKNYFAPLYKLWVYLKYIIYARKVIVERKNNARKVDLIVTYDPLVTGLMGFIISRVFHIPLVVEVNGDYTHWANYAHISSEFRQKLKRKTAITLEGFVLKHAHGIQLLYKNQIDFFQNKLNNQVVRVFTYYLNIENFRNRGERKAVTIIGFPFHVKGIDIAIEAFNRVASDFPDWHLEILGWFPQNEARLIKSLISNNKQIIRLNVIPRETMPEYIGKIGIVLCASRTEGFPRVLVEAMVSAKPCIASSVGGIPEVLENQVNGLIFEPENIAQLAECLANLMGKPALRQKLAKNAAEFASQNFTDDIHLNNIKEFYMSVINQKRDILSG